MRCRGDQEPEQKNNGEQCCTVCKQVEEIEARLHPHCQRTKHMDPTWIPVQNSFFQNPRLHREFGAGVSWRATPVHIWSHLMHQKPQKDQGATRGINSTRVCHGFQEILSTPMLLIVVRRPLLVHGVTLVASGFSGRSRASREIRAMIWLAVGLGCCLLRLAH